MKRLCLAWAALALPIALAAQEPVASTPANTASPIVDAVKRATTNLERDLTLAADTVPASLLDYRLTPAQLSFADIWDHLARANNQLCGLVGGSPAPKLAPKDTTAAPVKDSLVAHLKASFAFCDAQIARARDAQLSDEVALPNGRKVLRFRALFIYAMDLQDHYSQVANYMRANNMLPPSAWPRTRRDDR